jgi:C-terminal peptidase prc
MQYRTRTIGAQKTPHICLLSLAAAATLLVACGDATPSVGPSPGAATVDTPISTPSSTPPTLTVSEETTARQLRVFTHLWETVRDTYVYPDFNGLDWDEVGQRYRARIEAGLTDDDFYQAMREMIDELGDEHSVFSSPQEVAEEDERVSGQLNYVGIGVYVTTLFDKGYGVLLQVFPASPAERAGLQPHDRILAVDGAPAVGAGQVDNLELLVGLVGSQVHLTVQTPGQEPRELTVTRERIQTQLPVDAYRFPGTDIGYLMIPTFWDQTVAERVRQALDGLTAHRELKGLIVDMRINGGGLDTALRDTLSIFTHGQVGAFVSREAERPLVIEAKPVGHSQTLPLVVLVGRETVSFGEIFSGVLQESGRAYLVGRTTDGNVETLWQTDFEDGSRAWIAAETFRPLSSADWEASGIAPDVEIPLDWDEFSAQDDPQLQAALDWLLASQNP